MRRWFSARSGWLLALIFIIGLFMVIGCGGGGGGGSEGGGGGTGDNIPPDDNNQPQVDQSDVDAVSLYCTSPTNETAFTSDSSTVTVAGEATGPAESVTWANLTTGDSGSATGVESWTATIPLEQGDNEVEITALSTEANKDVTMPLAITHNTSVAFTSLPQLTPDAGFTNVNQDPVYVRVGIDDTNLDASSIKVFQLDLDGTQLAELGTLLDNGKLSNGDEIEGDGIYSAKISLESTYERLIKMRIYAGDDQGTISMSPMFSFVFFDEPDDDALDQQEAVNNQVLDKLESLIKTEKNETGVTEEEAAIAAIEDLVDYLEGLDSVADVTRGDSAVWWITEQGIQFVIDLNLDRTDELNRSAQDDEWSSDWEDMRTPDEAARIEQLKTHVEYLKPPSEPNLYSAVLPMADADDDKYIVGSHDAVIISPWKELHKYVTHSSSAWSDVIKKSDCLSDTEFVNTIGDPMTDLNSGAVPLQRWKELSKYGLISVLTHGTSLKKATKAAEKFANKYFNKKYPTILEEFRKKYPGETESVIKAKAREATEEYLKRRFAFVGVWNTAEREMFTTNIRIDASKEKWKTYMKDPQLGPEIKTGRIIPVLKYEKQPIKLIGYNLYVTPEFIKFHNKDPFPKSIFYALACYGGAHRNQASSMAQVVKEKGALAYIGYSHSVKGSYAIRTQHKVFDEMINQGKTVKEALDAARAAHGTNDADDTPAYLKGSGEGKAYFDFNLKNPSFEEPEGTGSTNGWTTDGDARRLKKLGSELPLSGKNMAIISSGFVSTSYGKLSQAVCLSTKVKELKFDWNFYSEEFKEYCQRGYDDTFVVSITEKESGVEKTLFKTSVDTLCQGCNGSDLESAACKNLPLQASDVSFDRGGVWTTGWNISETASLADYQGKAATIRFYIEDKGDTSYDTAVLLDDIKIIEE
jgi:hypothetical protein